MVRRYDFACILSFVFALVVYVIAPDPIGYVGQDLPISVRTGFVSWHFIVFYCLIFSGIVFMCLSFRGVENE